MVSLRYTISRMAPPGSEWAVRITIYPHTVGDSNGTGMFAYHWHPAGHSPIVTPHLHIFDPALAWKPLAGAHLPTGMISVVDLIRTLISEFHVTPRRRDRAAVLDRAHWGKDSFRSVPDQAATVRSS
jgi:hypothetical protein